MDSRSVEDYMFTGTLISVLLFLTGSAPQDAHPTGGPYPPEYLIWDDGPGGGGGGGGGSCGCSNICPSWYVLEDPSYNHETFAYTGCSKSGGTLTCNYRGMKTGNLLSRSMGCY
jgi:hypothetical protein